MHKDKFRSFALEALERGCDRVRWALLYCLSVRDINDKFAQDIFSRKLTVEDLSFFIYKIRGEEMNTSVIVTAFENLLAYLRQWIKSIITIKSMTT